LSSVTLLKAILRTGGVLLSSAAVAVCLPRETMVATNAWLGLDPLAETPLTFYLARSASALYAVHGAILLLASTDPVRYRTLVLLLGALNIAFGAALLGIDRTAGMPDWWTAAEGPGVFVIGVVLVVLATRLEHEGQG
jgi:hypothetical protein